MTRQTIDELEIMTPDLLGSLLYLVIAQPYPNFQYIQDILHVGCPIDGRDGAGCTPLHMASKLRKLDVMEYLISNGADVNARDNMGWTALHKAIVDGDLEVAEFLISRGADVNARDIDDQTPLYHATRVIRCIISLWVDDDDENELENENFDLHKDFKVIHFLLSKGAEVDVRTKYGWRAWDIATDEIKEIFPELEPHD